MISLVLGFFIFMADSLNGISYKQGTLVPGALQELAGAIFIGSIIDDPVYDGICRIDTTSCQSDKPDYPAKIEGKSAPVNLS